MRLISNKKFIPTNDNLVKRVVNIVVSLIAIIIADKYFDERMVFTLIIMVIILLILTPVGIVVDKKIEAYFENKIEP